MERLTNPKNDRRSITHTGSDVGADNVTLTSNTPDREDPVIEWECPRKYDLMTYQGGRHLTKFVPRCKESITGSGDDDTEVELDANIVPVAGETDSDDWPYPPVVAYNVTQGERIDLDDIHYGSNTVTLASDPNDGDDVALFPVMADGVVKYVGHDQFGNRVGSLDTYGIPLHVFHDFEHDRNETQIHLTGAVSWEEAESLALYVDSPDQIVWADDDYPLGSYASTIEQRVDVDV